MTITTATVTGPVVLPNGDAPLEGQIIFQLSSWDVEDGEGVVIPGPVTPFDLDADGNFSATLWVTAEGGASVTYEVMVVYEAFTGRQVKVLLGEIAIAAGGSYEIMQLLSVPVPAPASGDVLAQAIAAQAAAEEAQGDAETARTGAQTAQGLAEAARDDINARFFETRAEVEAADTGDAEFIYIGKLAYKYDATGTSISDANGRSYSPHGIVYVEHFGAVADLEYELRFEPDKHPEYGDVGTGAEGFVRTAGTNIADIIRQADAYAASVGEDLWWSNGGYLIDIEGEDEIRPLSRWKSENDFGATLWLKYGIDGSGRHQSGIAFYNSYTGLGVRDDHGFQLIGQFTSGGPGNPKPGGNGDRGTIARTNQFHSDEAQPILFGMSFRAKMVRAALERDAAGVVSQRSVSSIQLAAMGGLEKSAFQHGSFGKTNVSSSRRFLAHWAAHSDWTGYDPVVDEPTELPLFETYHFLDNVVESLNPVDNRDGHGFVQTWEIAAGGGFRVGPHTSYGVSGGSGALGGGCGGVTCGDFVDAYAHPDQKGRIGKGWFVDVQTAYEVTPTAGSEAFYIKGSGTAKDPDDTEFGTTVLNQRQQPMDGHCAGFYIEAASGADRSLGRAVFLEDVSGIVDLGVVETQGFARGVEVENCHGLFKWTQRGDGVPINNFSSICTPVIETDLGDEANAADTDNYARGHTSPNSRAHEVVGREVSLPTVNGAHSIGDTRLDLVSATTGNQVFIGDKLLIDDSFEVTVRELAAIGSTSIEISPLLVALTGGETVTLIQRAITKDPVFAFASSRNGVIVGKHGEVSGADASRVQYYGAHLAKVTDNGKFSLNSGKMPYGGRASTALSNKRLIRAEDNAHVSLSRVDCVDDPNITTVLQLLDSATASVNGCLIPQPTGFVSSARDLIDALSWHGNYDDSGNPVFAPDHEGTWTPVLKIGTNEVTSYTAQQGTYTYLGNGRFLAVFDMVITSKDGLTGDLSITGWPHGISSDGLEGDGTGHLAITNASLTTPSPFILLFGGEALLFRQATSGTAALDDTQIDADARLRGHLIYRRA